MKELAALAYRDTTSENRQFWKNEMSKALREIQETYDEKLMIMRSELEAYYNLKVRWYTKAKRVPEIKPYYLCSIKPTTRQ